MATTTERPSELEELERDLTARLDEETGRVEADVNAAADEELAEEEVEAERPSPRLTVAVGCSVVASAIMLGGIFDGVSPRVYAVLAGVLGMALAVVAVRIRRASTANLVVLVGLFGIGVLAVVPDGLGNVFDIKRLAEHAVASGEVLRPPVPFLLGWQAILAWIMAIVGFSTAWIAVGMRKPALGMLLPLPLAGLAGISVPEEAQVPSGIAVLVLFAIGLGLLSSAQRMGDEGEKLPLAYEVRKAVKSLPLLVLVTIVLLFLSKSDFLFPDPVYDPTQEPQKPKSVPLSEVADRVLFEVESSVSGPWRVGQLDVYDGKDWRLPPFSQSQLDKVPRSGIVDKDLEAKVTATFTVKDLQGNVLPGLPNTVGLAARGPLLAYDPRNGNIRVAEGQIEAGLVYTVVAAGLPTTNDLRKVPRDVPPELRPFTEIGEPPRAVRELLGRAPTESMWDTFDFARTFVLDNVTATGAGTPVSITSERVEDILAGSQEASPFEIVATQAMLARWIGLPSRIGYGFDGGELVDGRFQVRPRHGASFVEVYFPGYKWLPVIGTPKKAKPKSGADATETQTNPNVAPSEDVGVQLVFPVMTPAPSILGEQVKRAVLVIVPLLLLLLLLYVAYPGARKALLRARHRSTARTAGPRARIALAYAEWRDYCTDLGMAHESDTPLAFLERFVDDDEHRELAWLTTRALWGDLQSSCTEDLANHAEELSRALRRRLASTKSPALRAIAAVSRLSLRRPFAAGAALFGSEPGKERHRAAA